MVSADMHDTYTSTNGSVSLPVYSPFNTLCLHLDSANSYTATGDLYAYHPKDPIGNFCYSTAATEEEIDPNTYTTARINDVAYLDWFDTRSAHFSAAIPTGYNFMSVERNSTQMIANINYEVANNYRSQVFKVGYTAPGLINFSAIGDAHLITDVTAISNGVVYTSWNSRSDGTQNASRNIPMNSKLLISYSADSYYRYKNKDVGGISNYTQAINTENTHLATASGYAPATDSYISATSDLYYVRFTCTMDAKTASYSKLGAAMNASGGIYYMDLKPTACSVSSNNSQIPTAALVSTSNAPYVTYCSAFNTASKVTGNSSLGTSVTYRTPYFGTYNLSAGRVSGTVNVTARNRHVNTVWTSNGASGSNRSLYLRSLSSNASNTTGWGTVAYNGNLFTGAGTGSIKTFNTAFTFNYACLPVCTRGWIMNMGAALGVPAASTAKTASRMCPPNQIVNANGTVVVSGLIK